MLSNGQLACLLTSRNGYGCASEFLLYEKYDRKPTIIGTQVNYPWWWKTNDESNYEYIKLSNHYINDQITPPNDFSLADRTADGKIDVRGRTLNTAELTPLTKRLHTVFTNKANNKIERDFNYKMYRSWEYWLLVLGLAAGIYGGSAAGYLPHFIIDYPLIAMPIFYFFGGGIIWKILETKSHYAEHHPDHPWIRFDELLSRIFPKIINLQTLTATLAPLALSATFLPVYAPKYTRHFSSLMDMAWHYPILYVIPATYLLAIGLSLTRKKWLSFLYPCLLAIGSIATFVVNFALTHITVDTPEPYTTIALVSFFAIPAAGFILWGTRQDQENKRAKKRAN